MKATKPKLALSLSFISARLRLSTVDVGILVAVIMEVAVLDHGDNECVAMYVMKPACLRVGLVFSVVFVRYSNFTSVLEALH